MQQCHFEAHQYISILKSFLNHKHNDKHATPSEHQFSAILRERTPNQILRTNICNLNLNSRVQEDITVFKARNVKDNSFIPRTTAFVFHCRASQQISLPAGSHQSLQLCVECTSHQFNSSYFDITLSTAESPPPPKSITWVCSIFTE